MKGAAFAWLLVTLVGFGSGRLGAEPSQLEEIPYPVLGQAEPEVRAQLKGARERLQAALEAELSASDLAASFGTLAELYHGYDLTQAAMAAYRNALLLKSGEPRWLYLLGALQRREGELEAAVISFSGVLELEPENVAAILQLAGVEYELGNLDSASAWARRALEAGSENAPAHALLGRVAAARGDHGAAAQNFEKALELAPEATRLHYLAGQAHRRSGDLEAARFHLQRRGDGEATFADPRLASIFTSLAGSAALMQRAAKAEIAGRLEASVAIYRQAVENAPRSPEARRDLGALLARVGRHGEAADQYRAAVELEPERGLNHFVLGLMLEVIGESAEALASIQRAVEAEPDYREFRLALAGRLANLGRLDEAAAHLDRVLSTSESGGAPLERAHLERAKIRLEMGDAAGALEDAQAVLGADSSEAWRAEALAVEGAVASRSGERDKAIGLFQQALDLDGDLAVAHFELANLAGISGDFQTAVMHYRRTLEVEPDKVAAWLGEATALALAGDEKQAVARLEIGVEKLPEAEVLGSTLAHLLALSQDPAVRDPERALELAADLFEAAETTQNGDLLVQALAVSGRLQAALRLQRQLLEALPPEADPRLREAWSARLDQLQRAQRSEAP